jgi:hypothetical protein
MWVQTKSFWGPYIRPELFNVVIEYDGDEDEEEE